MENLWTNECRFLEEAPENDMTLEEATRLLAQSHREILELMEGFSNDELFTKGVYKWTGGTSLGSYFVSSTSSHYEWASKKLKAHQKNCKFH